MKNPNICGKPICEGIDRMTKFIWQYIIEIIAFAGINQKFRFERNLAYKYEYSTHLKTHFDSTGNNVSELFVTGKVELIFPTPCEGILKMTNIKLRSMMDVVVEDQEYEEYEDPDEEFVGMHPKSSMFADDIQKFDLRLLQYKFNFLYLTQ